MDNSNGRRPQPEGRSFRAGGNQSATPSRPVVAPIQGSSQQAPKQTTGPASSPDQSRASQQPATKPKAKRSDNPAKKALQTINTWAAKHRRQAVFLGLVLIIAAGSGVWWLHQRNSSDNTASSEVARQYQEQIPELRSKVRDNPDDASARKNYAVALYATQNLGEARKQYEEATKLNDKDATAFNNLGNVYRDLGELDKAIESYRKSIELNPKVIHSYANLANIQLYSRDQPDEAIKTYQAGLKELPDDAQLELLLAIAYEQKGDQAKAKSTYQNILSRDSDNAAAKANLERLEAED